MFRIFETETILQYLTSSTWQQLDVSCTFCQKRCEQAVRNMRRKMFIVNIALYSSWVSELQSFCFSSVQYLAYAISTSEKEREG